MKVNASPERLVRGEAPAQDGPPLRGPSAVTLSSVLDKESGSSRPVSVFAVLGTIAMHAMIAVTAVRFAKGEVRRDPGAAGLITQMVDIELPPPAPHAPPPPPQETPVPKAASRPSPSMRAQGPPSATHPRDPVHTTAQAGQALTRLPSQEDIVDFDDTIISGNGARYAGGATAAGGRDTQAVHELPTQGGGSEEGGDSDLSSPPRLAGAAQWECPFPPEADDAGIDQAVVTLRVEVTAEGQVLSAVATTDAGHGFGREARRCALGKRWAPGRDRRGRPITTTTHVKVSFSR